MSRKPGFEDCVKAAIQHRAGGACEIRLPGCFRGGCHHHHRKRRWLGDHSTANGLLLCTSCHGRVHDVIHRDAAIVCGYIVPQHIDPADVTVIPGFQGKTLGEALAYRQAWLDHPVFGG